MNQKGFFGIFAGIILITLVLVAGGFGFYYYFASIKKSSVKSSLPTPSPNVVIASSAPIVPTATVILKPSPSAKSNSVLELGGFPIYPGAVFVEKREATPCPSSIQGGFTSCGETLYVFRTDGPAPDFFNFYHSENNGWVMSGGAGETDQERNNYSGQISLKKNKLDYALHFAASEGKVTDYIIGIPTK